MNSTLWQRQWLSEPTTSISAGQTTTVTTQRKSLTVSGITASNKMYDGNTVATLNHQM